MYVLVISGVIFLGARWADTTVPRKTVRCWLPNGDLVYEGHTTDRHVRSGESVHFTDDRTGRVITMINMPCAVRSGGKLMLISKPITQQPWRRLLTAARWCWRAYAVYATVGYARQIGASYNRMTAARTRRPFF